MSKTDYKKNTSITNRLFLIYFNIICLLLPQVLNAQEIKNNSTSTKFPAFAYIGILGLLLLAGALQFYFPNYLRTCLSYFTSKKQLQIFNQADFISRAMPGGIFDFLYVILFGIFTILVHQVFSKTMINYLSPSNIALISGITAVTLIFKIYLRRLLIWVFHWEFFGEEGTFLLKFKRHLSVVWLLPVIILCSFSPISKVLVQPLVMLTALILIILNILVIYKVRKSMIEGGKITINEFFLYFCIGEIIPLALIIKLSYSLLIK
jgi:hypothetical protein